MHYPFHGCVPGHVQFLFLSHPGEPNRTWRHHVARMCNKEQMLSKLGDFRVSGAEYLGTSHQGRGHSKNLNPGVRIPRSASLGPSLSNSPSSWPCALETLGHVN